MAAETGIKWTDSTYNSWWGCTKVGPACDHCYAEGVDGRTGGGHWGHGAPRRLLSEHARNEPYRWNRKADQFFVEHGRRQRVFTLSMGDLFDKEVDAEWRMEHMNTMTACDRLEWQICTKRITNLRKGTIPESWDNGISSAWPRNVGVLVTIVTQAEADRDIPRLLSAKVRFGIPWVGISYEPAQEGINFRRWLSANDEQETLDWIIFGGKSGGQWNDRPFSLDWAYSTMSQCEGGDTPFFMKQVAAFRPTDAMIPADLMVRQWPKGH